ncbi:MAG: HlyD family secretion protein [Ancalomicrobiaceae bacterium]|nr:HlyD family secretion protein [Ancalomicrobiaceae bacterium]
MNEPRPRLENGQNVPLPIISARTLTADGTPARAGAAAVSSDAPAPSGPALPLRVKKRRPPAGSEPGSDLGLDAQPAETRRRTSLTRPILFALLPIVLLAGAWFCVTGGRVMTTDNAYVQARKLPVSTDVSGTVIEIAVHENEQVETGRVLYRLKPDSYRTALDAARAQLGTVRDQVLTLKASYQQALAVIDQAKADLPYYQATFDRQQNLLKSSNVSQAAFDTARHDLISAQSKVSVAEAQARAVLAQLSGDPDQKLEDNPFYRQAKTGVENAERDLEDTVVRAPYSGVVTNVNALEIGKQLAANAPAFSLVADKDLWVEADPKETELTDVRPGQPATISVDTYPDAVWHGHVLSISPASSSSFSLLPAQNSSGNWVKVVQRIPVRLSIEDPDGKPPLRMGMSVVVGIDTGHARGLPTWLSDWLPASLNDPLRKLVASYGQ